MSRPALILVTLLSFGPVSSFAHQTKEPSQQDTKLAQGTVQPSQQSPQPSDPLEALFQPKIQRLKNFRAFIDQAKKKNEDTTAAENGLKTEATELTLFLQPYLNAQLRDQGYRFALSSIEESRW